ncbi:hypothetical protein M8C21_026144 [Ambrosia artemisiifolia]|uniref:Uncharacterized protein n=1 Tax=Ambrosia artemisiifolia TaxID=4212 RepID=A0AAD5D9H2_AMBAR|nr:hypothetical protein M8C21_026144 [Ambrosia artemisiifolia]
MVYNQNIKENTLWADYGHQSRGCAKHMIPAQRVMENPQAFLVYDIGWDGDEAFALTINGSGSTKQRTDNTLGHCKFEDVEKLVSPTRLLENQPSLSLYLKSRNH